MSTEAPPRQLPDPSQVPLVAPTVSALLRRNGTDPDRRGRVAVRYGDLTWTHGDFWTECLRWAAVMRTWRPDDGTPFHVGVLLDNTPAYLAALGGAALSGAALVGLNPTRQGEHLATDVRHVELCAVVTEPRHAALLAPLVDRLGVPRDRLFTTRAFADETESELGLLGGDLDALLRSHDGAADVGPDADPALTSTWCLVFTSGTSAAPKAVICSQRRMLVTGERMRMVLEIGADDVGYLCMPLFHSNALMVGLMPALIAGASVALRRRFSARGWLPDLRRYGVTYWNYTGKPLAYLLATEARPDDADNPLRRAYGNEGADGIVARFAERFGTEVLDAFGPTEGGVGILRGSDDPPGALGRAGGHVKVVDPDGVELPRARLDPSGRVLNVEEAVGEIVNTAGPGPFEGYWGNEEATARATRGGWYWTGDLGYVDDAGFVYFAGRSSDWLRVDGENFPVGPIDAALSRHPDLLAAAAFGVPDPAAGDRVMCAVVPQPGRDLDPAAFAAWLDDQPDLAPKWRPTLVRVTRSLPRTPTHKVLVRQLQSEKWRRDRIGDDLLWQRGRGAGAFVPFGAQDEQELHRRFVEHGRERFWDL